MFAFTNLVTVSVAGSPVVLPDTQGYRPLAIYIQSWKDNAADGYLGVSTMDKGTGAGVIKKLDAAVGDFTIGSPMGLSEVSVRDYYLDADANGQTFLVTYWCK